ncbi:MAG: MMPL family transporter, partial [Bacteroidota bacterium]|nr:MMPL family transporter [Bacteroidota bacterium]
YIGDPEKVLQDESTPVVLGVLTTMGAFCGLIFTQSELLRDFGIFASLALFGSTLFALIFLPHFLPKGDTGKNKKAFRIIDRISAYSIDKRKIPMIIIGIVTVVCICFSPKISFDKDLRNLSYFEEETLRSEKLFADMNYNRDSINAYYAASAPTLDEALAYNRQIIRKVDSLQDLGIVHNYSGVTSKIFIPEEEQRERIAAWNEYWTPEKKAQTRSVLRQAAREAGYNSEFLLFNELLDTDYDEDETFNVYESGLFPESVTSNFIECCEGRFLVFTPVQCSTMEEKDIISDTVTDKGMSDHAIAVDPMYYIRDMVEIVHRDFDLAVEISSIFVLLVLLISFKSIWSAILSFIPMALSWYVVQGAMVLLGLQFNLINIVISTFIFGIGVDYSIFVMEGLLAIARSGSSKLLVWHKSAIFFSAIVLLIVMCSLLFAVHPSISSIGLTALIGMATTVIFSYTIQPWLFRQMMKVPYFRRCFAKQ